MDLTPIKNIDIVLKTFYEKGKNGFEFNVAQKESGILDDEEFKRIFLRLRKDEFLTLDGSVFTISYDGVLHHLSNGYMGQYIRNQSLIEMSQRTEKSAQDLVDWTANLAIRTKELRNWTRAVAIGAIGLVLWEVFVFLWEHFLKCH